MDLKDIASLVHFRELHFLPRVIFSVGAVLLIGSFFVKLFLLGFLGVVLIFAGSALNLVINTLLGIGASVKDKSTAFPWTLLLQSALAIVLATTTSWLLYYYYHCGEMPVFLRPLK